MIDERLNDCRICGSPAEFDTDSGSYGYYPPSIGVRCSDKGCGLNLPRRSVRDRPQDTDRPTETEVRGDLVAKWNSL